MDSARQIESGRSQSQDAANDLSCGIPLMRDDQDAGTDRLRSSHARCSDAKSRALALTRIRPCAAARIHTLRSAGAEQNPRQSRTSQFRAEAANGKNDALVISLLFSLDIGVDLPFVRVIE